MGTVTMTGVGKAFKHYPSRWRRLFDWLLPFGEQHYESHWVLRDITIDIKAGEAVALVGMNGAGKSTLLKLISGTLQPTTGTIEVQGRLAALLELGIGFHPDFTGRQNVFMAGQLLGLTQSEIQALMPEIEAFAEIGDYIDQPVRVYSSGMQVRLAFSIATAQRPDVLVIDEALSVGDAHFQHKSFERIQEYRALGTTLLIVSHDKNAIQTICDRVVILNQGQLVVQGAPDAMFDVYNALIAKADEKNLVKEASESGALQLVTGSGEAKVTSIRLFDESEQCDVAVVSVGQRVCLDVVVAIHSEIPKLVFGFSIRNRLGQVMFGTNTFFTNQAITNLKSGETYKFSVHLETNLGPGIYSLSTALVNSSNHLDANYEWRDRALTFEVVNSDKPFFEGQTYLSPTIEVH